MNKKMAPLEALSELRFNGLTEKYKNKCCDIIETTLKENEKLKELYEEELKNTAYYNNLALKYKKTLEIFKRYIQLEDDKIFALGWEWNLTKEEYDLLKEVLL